MLHVPLVRSYSSDEVRKPPKVRSLPPATSTSPVGSRVAVWKARLLFTLPVVLQVPLPGSYTSDGAALPTTNTSPVFSRVAVWAFRARLMLPVGLHVPVAGSYSSADDRLWPAMPPLTRTLPVESR